VPLIMGVRFDDPNARIDDGEVTTTSFFPSISLPFRFFCTLCSQSICEWEVTMSIHLDAAGGRLGLAGC
jgi:hypothetical protein